MGKPHILRATRVALTGLAAVSLATGALLAASPLAAAASDTSQGSSHSVANPYSPAYDHPYRHGVLPTIGQNAKMKNWAEQQASPAVTGPQTLSYGGGVDGIGVQSGHSKVYLVFYGTQWGTQSTNSKGDLTFSGDSAGAAPVAQEMFKGIGTGNELWSADLTQWCDGPNVAAGATSCPSNANFIPYQTGGVLSGVWYDNSAASPSAASGHQLGVEAVKAASHFGNTTAASNRYAYYVILSPHGTNPDNYQGQYCAWHDWNGDTTLTGGAVSSTVGDVAFSNQPYNIDSGAGCGVGFVNSPGTLDGWTMTLGHEWHEMMSDQNPAGGWTNHTGSSYNGQENSDECAWISPGQTGGAANVTMGSAGTFAEQASWSNDTNSCAISHPIVGGGGGTGCTAAQLLGNPGFETGTASPWTASAGVIDNSTGEPAHSGSWKAWLNGYGTTHTDTLSQAVTIPSSCTSATFTFWLHIDTAETTTTTAYDTLTVQAGSTTLATYSNLNKNTGYVQKSFSLNGFIGQTVTLKFTGTEDSSLQTSFVVDDTAVNVS